MAPRKQEVDEHSEEKSQHTQNTKRTRITFDVSPELRLRIKVAAARKNLSIGEFLSDIIEQELPKEPTVKKQQRRPVTREYAENLDKVREKISQEHNGEPFEDSTEMIRQMREERAEYLASLHTIIGESS